MTRKRQEKIIRDKTGSVTLTLSPERYAVTMVEPVLWRSAETRMVGRSPGWESFHVDKKHGTFDTAKWCERLKGRETFTVFDQKWLLVTVLETRLSFQRMET